MKIHSIAYKKFLLLGMLFLLFLSFFYFHLYEYLSFTKIKQSQAIIQHWTLIHYPIVVLLYILIFIVLIACAIPCATFFTLIGGFLFGSIAVIYAVFSITLGGAVLFFAVRTAIGSHIAQKSSGWIKKMEYGFQKNAFHYLLLLRLVPFFPCWLSNVAAGALNVPFKTFIMATMLGVLPCTFICVLLGKGLDKVLIADQNSLKNILFTPSIFLPLLALAFLTMIPIIYKSIKK